MLSGFTTTASPNVAFGNCYGSQASRLLVILKLVFDVSDLGASVGCRQAVLAQVDEDHLVDRQDAFASDLVTHFASQGDGGTSEFSGGDAQLDDVALA